MIIALLPQYLLGIAGLAALTLMHSLTRSGFGPTEVARGDLDEGLGSQWLPRGVVGSAAVENSAALSVRRLLRGAHSPEYPDPDPLLTSRGVANEALEVLARLNVAVMMSDGDAVADLTTQLRKLIPSAEGAVGPSDRVAKRDAACIFDDYLFKLSREKKRELRSQLSELSQMDAVDWAQRGGWYRCAAEGGSCACIGEVRYGFPHGEQWSPHKAVTSSVSCSNQEFGDPAPYQPKECQCHRSEFTLEKHGNSVTLLQEAFIFLLRLLGKNRWLPFTGDKTFGGLELWFTRQGREAHSENADRYWMAKWLHESGSLVEGPDCMEWAGGQDYLHRFPSCTKKHWLEYRPERISTKGEMVYGDIYALHDSGLQMNTILCTQVFEHLEHPELAAQAVFSSLKPGGVLLYSSPHISPLHPMPGDFARYTKMKVYSMLTAAGFCVPKPKMSGGGDFIFDVALFTGMRVSDFTSEELDSAFQRGYDNISDGAMNIFAVAYKPPHPACVQTLPKVDEIPDWFLHAQWYRRQIFDIDLRGVREARNRSKVRPISQPDALRPFGRRMHKIAFLFLLETGLDHEEIWEKFFQDADPALFSVYVHRSLPNASSDGLPNLPNTKGVPHVASQWCALMGAELAALNEALQDPDNQQFVFISHDAIPLKRFDDVYSSLMMDSVNRSKVCFASSTNNLGDCRFRDPNHWRPGNVLKHHQWIILARHHAEIVLNNAEDALIKYDALREGTLKTYRDPKMCSDESMPVMSLLDHASPVQSSPPTASRASDIWSRLLSLGVDQHCTTFVYWPRCLKGTRFDLDSVNTQPSVHPHTFAEIERDYLVNLVNTPLLFARKFLPEASVVTFDAALQPVPLRRVLPTLWPQTPLVQQLPFFRLDGQRGLDS
jgi:hypothetical protein